MLTLPPSVRIYLARGSTDIRKGIDGLCALARDVVGEDPFSGHLFAFLNRRKNHVKMLVWTRGGFMIVQKKLEAGTFAFARQLTNDARRIEVEAHELAMLLEGIDARSVKFAPRWAPKK